MKFLKAVSSRVVLASLTLCPSLGLACDHLATGETLWIRLSSPVTTFSAKPGDRVMAVLTQAIECDNEVLFPIGTGIEGEVRSVRKVGWGIRHETAALDVEFNRLVPAVGPAVPISAAVVEVENAREQVVKGKIQGIRSSDSPQGRINSRLRHLPTWNPYSDAGLIAFKATFPIFPEPEIYFPKGTDIRLELTAPVASLPLAPLPPVMAWMDTTQSMELESTAASFPRRTTTPKMVDADLINLAFVGSREQVEAAFHDAGWVNSDVFTKRSFMRDFYAFLNNSGYPQAPMRPFLLEGKPADMNWEKSLNSYARRDHLRMWQWPDASESATVWLSSSTHDTGAALSVKRRQFLHHIAPDIDEERSKVIRDLTAAGCVQSVHLLDRPGIATSTENATGDPVWTDGQLAVVELKDCQPVVPELASAPESANFKPGNHLFRYCRRQILTFRSDIWRANIIYGVYDLGRMSVNAMKHRSAATTSQEALKQPPPHHIDAGQIAANPLGVPEPADTTGFR